MGNALEHREAERVSHSLALRIRLLAELARRRYWILGMVGDTGAWVLQALALSLGSLVFVQPLLVMGLVFTLPLSAWLTNRRYPRVDWLFAVLLAASLAVFLVDARPSAGIDQAPLRDWIVLAPVLGGFVAGCVLGALRGVPVLRGLLLGAAAGTVFGVTSSLTKMFVHELGGGIPAMLKNWEPYALAVLMLLGLVLLNSAYQAGALTVSLPAAEVGEPLIAMIIGIVLLDERVDVPTVADKVVIALSVLGMVVAVLALARSAARSQAPRPALEVQPAPPAGVAPAGD